MEELLLYQSNLLKQVNNKWQRYLFDRIHTKERLIGIKGLRGVGKTTMLLQFLKYHFQDFERGIYVTADHPYFFNHTLFEFANEWYSHNGTLLLIDEVHKYPNWSRELKLIYDGHPNLQVIFTSSSALDIYQGESDLSRRLFLLNLPGLSFREYLTFIHQLEFPAFSLDEIIEDARSISTQLTMDFKPLALFKAYLKDGYFPFSRSLATEQIPERLIRVINTVLESDLSYVQDYSASNTVALKKLLGVIAESAPFTPNITKIADRLKIGRNTVLNYLKHLSDAYILNLAHQPGKGMSILQKPEKVYFENTAFTYAFQESPDIGTLRETFFLNQLKNANYDISLSKAGDFLLENRYVFEVGGKNKDKSQVKGIENAYLALDDIEIGFSQKIPLWLFGFLY
ncbi:MAG: ATP-binding protein [Cyclobacteriaceae bacterium]|nr:ATP-binding protein [Cyclobacteriaceae bacterium SS2]